MIGALKDLLARPAIFDAYQAMVGANYAKRVFVRDWVRPAKGDRVLDIGCGTGAVVPFLPDGLDITGIDISDDYIAAARARYGARAAFRVGDAADPAIDLGGGFDAAYAFGVFHHMPDTIALRLFEGAMRRLRPGGRFISIDPTLIPGQSWASRFFVVNDRGRYIRSPDELRDLFGNHAPKLEVRTDLLRIPYAQALMAFEKPSAIARN